MSKKLIIVESPAKAKTIRGLLGGDYAVEASIGHIADLPKKTMGVRAPKYVPEYDVTKPDVVKRLRAAAKSASEIILATDPDREGEAIAHHLQTILKADGAKRVTYSEVTKRAILEALKSPRKVNMRLVRAQEARRVLDRLTGYRVSPVLSNLAGAALSAGRVQTPAVMLVVQREREIRDFVPTTHYGVLAKFNHAGKEFAAEWDFKPLIKAAKEGEEKGKYWLDREYAAAVAANAKAFTVSSVEKKKRERKAPAGFTTSTLQQAASSALKMKPKKTMEVAQQLFEGLGGEHGLITYHRTDSPNMSSEAIGELWEYLKGQGMAEYIPAIKNTWKAKDGSQEAHECIRPTDFSARQPKGLTADQAKLYDLIWKRAVASQMKPQVLDDTIIELLTNEVNGAPQRFTTRGSVELFAGWTKVYAGNDESVSRDKKESEADNQNLPSLKNGQQLAPAGVKLQEKKTQPPSRYTEAALVKKLEDEGIGRPSTYATIMETLHHRGYVVDGKGKLAPTQTAFVVADALSGRFRFADLGYTREIEGDLDRIVDGKAEYVAVVAGVDRQLDEELAALRGNVAIMGEQHQCPNEGCDGVLRRRTGKKGPFWGCSNYPNCNATRPDVDGKPGEQQPAPRQSDVPCPDCGKPLRRLQASKGPNKGKHFWGCTGFKDGCRFTAEDNGGQPAMHEEAI